MGWNNQGMASGAAQGAGAGAVAGPWGALAGGVIGGVMGGLNSPAQAPQMATPSAPVPYGAINTQQGGWYIDPVTGAQYYTSNDTGGQNSYDQYRNSSLLDRLMGGTGQGAADNLSQQIATQQALVDRLSNPAKTGLAAVDPKDFGLADYVDPKTGKLLDISNADYIAKHPNEFPEYQGMLKEFWGKDRGGTTFRQWIGDHYQKAVQPTYEKMMAAEKANRGNANTNDQALEAAKQKLSQLQGFQKSTAGVNAEIDNNPFLKQLAKERPEEYQQLVNAWKEQAAADKTKSQQDPTLPFNTGSDYSLPGFNADGTLASHDGTDLRSMLTAEWNNPSYNPSRVATPTLDPNAGEYARRAADFTSAGQFRGSRLAADRQAAARGMLSSATNEIGRAGDSLALGNALNANRFNALDYFNKAQNADFANRNAAEGTYQQGQALNSNRRLGLLGATANLENAQFGRAKDINDTVYSRQNNEFNLKNALAQQWRANYLQGLAGEAGAAGQRDAWDQQKWQNQTGFLNQLQGMQNQQFGQNLQNQQFGLNQVQTGLPVSQNWANANTSYNNALTGNQNQAAMFAAQQQAAAAAGSQNAMYQGVGALGANLYNYYNPKPTAQVDGK